MNDKKEIETTEAVRAVCQIGERFERWGRVADAAKEADKLRFARLNGVPWCGGSVWNLGSNVLKCGHCGPWEDQS